MGCEQNTSYHSVERESKIPEISQHQVKPPFFWGAHGFSLKTLICSRCSHGHHTWSPRTLPKLGCLFVVFMGTRGRKCIAKTLSDSDHLKLLDIWLDETWVKALGHTYSFLYLPSELGRPKLWVFLWTCWSFLKVFALLDCKLFGVRYYILSIFFFPST